MTRSRGANTIAGAAAVVLAALGMPAIAQTYDTSPYIGPYQVYDGPYLPPYYGAYTGRGYAPGDYGYYGPGQRGYSATVNSDVIGDAVNRGQPGCRRAYQNC